MRHHRKHNHWISRQLSATISLTLCLTIPFILAAAAHAQDPALTFKTLHKFSNSGSGGSAILAGLVRDPAGNLYGATFEGGNTGCGGLGCGVIFEVSPADTEIVLYTFTGGTDGGSPGTTLVRDSAGNLYGTASIGGDLGCSEGFGSGCGVVFKLSPTGQETVLHTFTGSPDGAIAGAGVPYANLLRDSAGNLYGTTGGGGVYGAGTVFEIDPAGNETILYNFCSQGGSACTDGEGPFAGVVRDSEGNLYGTTIAGGANSFCASYAVTCGTVFKLSSSGEETVLHSFAGYPTDGAGPVSGLVLDPAGNLYGTTESGGSVSCGGSGCGTVFEITAAGQESVLHNFGNGEDGAGPEAVLLRDKTGALYGTTTSGGTSGVGAVFELLSSGQETVLHSFDQKDGAFPYDGLIEDSAGNLYGTTYSCASLNCGGTVFEISR
jgi:uncharacterized repeat protein (TIGR03803 family)